MYSAVSYQMAQDRIADLHRQTRHDALARAARQTDKGQSRHRVPRLPGIAVRRLRTAWGTHT
jgi:hypothetical protein